MTIAFSASGYDGGGRGNAAGIDPNNSGFCSVSGDVWGARTSTTFGRLWQAKMQGVNNMPYGRAVAYSKLHSGRAYFGMGGLHAGAGAGGLYTQDTANVLFPKVGPGFGSLLGGGGGPGSGTAGFYPRAVGNMICVDLASGTEMVYGFGGNSLFRCADTGSGLGTAHTYAGTAPSLNAGKSVTLGPDGNLYAIDYGNRSSDTSVSGQSMWKIVNPRGSETISKISGPTGAGPLNALRTIGGKLWCLCATGLFFMNTSGGWSSPTANGLGGGGGLTFSDVGGVGQTMYVSTGNHPSGSNKCVAKSTDGGANFTWVTPPSSVKNTVLGTTRGFWLNTNNPGASMPNDNYGTNSMEVDPNNVNFVLLSGTRGAWVTTDGGTTWYPSVNGLMGTEVTQIAVGPGVGEAFNSDTDWAKNGTAIHTLNHYQTVIDGAKAPAYPATALQRTQPGTSGSSLVTFQISWTGSYYSITRQVGTGGKIPIEDSYFKGAVVAPRNLQVSSDGWVYVAQYGGVTVGSPGGTVITPPTTGAPTLDDTTPNVGSPVTVQTNDSTWDGTKPLTYTFQWQSQ